LDFPDAVTVPRRSQRAILRNAPWSAGVGFWHRAAGSPAQTECEQHRQAEPDENHARNHAVKVNPQKEGCHGVLPCQEFHEASPRFDYENEDEGDNLDDAQLDAPTVAAAILAAVSTGLQPGVFSPNSEAGLSVAATPRRRKVQATPSSP
jgi:hypothetical protein